MRFTTIYRDLLWRLVVLLGLAKRKLQRPTSKIIISLRVQVQAAASGSGFGGRILYDILITLLICNPAIPSGVYATLTGSQLK
jgi:hypothetical protein